MFFGLLLLVLGLVFSYLTWYLGDFIYMIIAITTYIFGVYSISLSIRRRNRKIQKLRNKNRENRRILKEKYKTERKKILSKKKIKKKIPISRKRKNNSNVVEKRL